MGIILHDYQTTIKSRFSLSGIGVHSGKPVSVHFNPADADTGIVFHCLSVDGPDNEIPALVSEVGGTDLSTILGDPSKHHVATVEHLMATVFALGIDNVAIDIDGSEVPILDGSAAMFVAAFDQAGIDVLASKRRFIRIVKPVRVENGASWAEFRPYDGTRFEVEIDFESPAIGRQSFAGELSADLFRNEICRARTFGFMKDVERLWAAGYALGSSLENSLVIGDDHRIINMDGLRYPDEFVRHKTLDAMGDLALAGARFIGCFRSYRGGHRLNASALRAVLCDTANFEIVETTRSRRGRAAEMTAIGMPTYAPWMI
ncbi:UDP-3-O-acyl-N-acetylglucosamine deacetylase [Mesorhizobium sp. NBSH29]|uniref:UDP-3-O-acyl-N-acetylglucosamine deacetylase n=1 Tax=Mesorhizobium sp. NBSH29 TaxID=2654249 RepID=UPI0018964AA2|nr:UDP-3-O-acyl-N-acetylglucosamine deacetylase [Mesorhizobium sp. NBSH29]QPC88195.1 UDP-3-O-acyl-N-acetylglucosamine deacetylase [Mesorhizobium sp. NBSH29]